MHKYLKKIPLYIIYSILFGLFITNSVSATENVDYNVSVASSLTLTIPTSSIVLNLDPSSKTFDSEDLTVSVGTNNKTGYTLTLSTPNDSTNLNRDTSTDGVSAIMPTLDPGTYTQATFTADKWGYKINSNTSIPSTVTSGYVPFVSGNTLMERSTAVNQDETELSLAAKIDYLQPAGSYSTELNFNIVANPLVQYIQDLNPTLCTTTPQTVVDKRDNQEYIIQKLKDGNCWMMTNLNLGAIALTEDLTSANTNLATTVTAATFNSWKKTRGDYASGYTTGEYIPLTSSNTSNGLDRDPVSDAPYGTLYNYYAASAGTISGENNNNAQVYDICPSGWRLPTSDANGEFQNLYNAYNTYAQMRASIADGGAAFTLSGHFETTVPEYQGGNYAHWWGSNVYDYNDRYQLWVGGSSVFPTNHNRRTYGFSIRCILNDPRTISDIFTMQEISPQIVAKMSNGDTATLEDSRDGQQYTVAKINGNLWMTRNLAIGCNGSGSTYGNTITPIELTPANTNITSNWTTPTDSLTLGLTLGDSYDDPRMECSSNYGAWYNYAAASAGTITGSSNSTAATSDICPAGWHLPNHSEMSSISSGYATDFNADSSGGMYQGGQQTGSGMVMYWSSDAYNANLRRALDYRTGANINPNNAGYRYYGEYTRCIAN